MKLHIRNYLAAAAILLTVSSPSVAFAADSSSPPAPTPDNMTLLQVFDLIRDSHWTHVDENTLLQGAVQGMLSTLKDPYTSYFTADQFQQFIDRMNQSYAGIGISLGQNDQGFFIQEVFPGTPGEQAGLKQGDQILSVDGQAVQNQTIDTVAGWLRGKADTSVGISIQHAGQAPTSVSVTRKAITLPTVTSAVLQDGMGYIRILSFGDQTTTEFEQALADLQKQGVQSLVLDLRGNGGGVMQSAEDIAKKFLKQGQEIVHIQQNNSQQDEVADLSGTDLPLSILVDGGTASASEILAGSLQADGRAQVIGTQTYGKGVFQSLNPLPNGDVLKLTIGQYYFANGFSPQGKGVTPDVCIQTEELQLPAAVETLHPDHAKSVQFNVAARTAAVNGTALSGQPVVLDNGKTYLPLRYTLESLGHPVSWDPSDDSVLFVTNGKTVKIQMDSGWVAVNGQLLNLDKPFELKDGRSYLSLEALQQILSGDQIQASSDTVTIQE